MKVKIIPAKSVIDFPRPMRVAAYCRVSTQQEIQHHSLELQQQYFDKYINGALNWTSVGIYAEQGSGLHHCNMKEFLRMMEDCRAGKIDYIADYFTSKQVPNRGEYECFLLRDHHTAIIPKCKWFLRKCKR